MKGSAQLRAYLRARRAGTERAEAAALVGFSVEEAKLTDADEARGLLADIDTTEPAPATAPTAPISHNSGGSTMSDVIAADQLRLFIERVERLEEEKKGIMDDIKDVYAEAKGCGYDTKTMREIVRLRKLEKHVREEREMMLDTYKAALGMDFAETPLGAATIERAARPTDVVKLAADIHAAGGRMVGDALVIPMEGAKACAQQRAVA